LSSKLICLSLSTIRSFRITIGGLLTILSGLRSFVNRRKMACWARRGRVVRGQNEQPVALVPAEPRDNVKISWQMKTTTSKMTARMTMTKEL